MVAPRDFKRIFSDFKPQFAGWKQQDINIEYIEIFGKSFKWIEVSTSLSASRFLKFHVLWQEDSQEFLSMFLAGLSLVLSLLQKTRAWIRHDTWQLLMTFERFWITFVNRHSKCRISAVPGEDVNRTTKKPYRELKDSEGRPDEEVPVRWCAMYQRRVWT